jgi:FMN phosphatase YigB (HAD superfamily)
MRITLTDELGEYKTTCYSCHSPIRKIRVFPVLQDESQEKAKLTDHPKAVFFDLGDTVVDLGEGRGDYEARLLMRAGHIYDLLAAEGLRLPPRDVFCRAFAEGSEGRYQAALAEQRGLGIHTVMTDFFVEQGLPVDDSLLAACEETYCGHDSVEILAPMRTGAAEVLGWLHAAGYRLGVISNTLQPARYMNRSLARRGLLHLFDATIYSSDAGIAKPHPGIFRAALDAIGVPAARAVHVGDRLVADVAGAQAAGLRAVLIRVAGRKEESPEITPDATIDELTELPIALEQLGM